MTLLLIPFLIWNRQWQALQVFGSIAAGLILVSVAIAGPEVLYAYPRFLLDSTGFEGQGVSTMSMLGLNGMIARLTNNPTPSNLWLVGIGIPIILLIAERWSRVQTISAPTSLLLCALTLLGALLLNPHLYLQDMILIGLVVALGALYARIETGSLGYWPGLGAGMWLVQFFSPQITPLIDINPITLSILALFAITYFELRKAERASSTAARSANAAPPLPDPLAA